MCRLYGGKCRAFKSNATDSKSHLILEVGTAVGFSTLLMSEYAPKDCRITTIENYAPWLVGQGLPSTTFSGASLIIVDQ